MSVKAVLLDIEGTVCPISFVKDVLFPYALNALPETLRTQWDNSSFLPYRTAFPLEHAGSPSTLEAHARDLINRDVKVSYLKSLQGYLWESGYASGALKAPIFPDVPPALRRWHASGVRVIIYSSGSVHAQKLLFRHTDAGDLTSLLTDYFDTLNAGPKTDVASYEKIVECHADVPRASWLFLSDNVREVEAARSAAMQSWVVERPGNAVLGKEVSRVHKIVRSFDWLGDPEARNMLE